MPGTAEKTVSDALRELKLRKGDKKTDDQFILITKSIEKKVWKNDEEIVARSLEMNATGRATKLTLAIEKALLRRLK